MCHSFFFLFFFFSSTLDRTENVRLDRLTFFRSLSSFGIESSQRDRRNALFFSLARGAQVVGRKRRVEIEGDSLGRTFAPCDSVGLWVASVAQTESSLTIGKSTKTMTLDPTAGMSSRQRQDAEGPSLSLFGEMGVHFSCVSFRSAPLFSFSFFQSPRRLFPNGSRAPSDPNRTKGRAKEEEKKKKRAAAWQRRSAVDPFVSTMSFFFEEKGKKKGFGAPRQVPALPGPRPLFLLHRWPLACVFDATQTKRALLFLSQTREKTRVPTRKREQRVPARVGKEKQE